MKKPYAHLIQLLLVFFELLIGCGAEEKALPEPGTDSSLGVVSEVTSVAMRSLHLILPIGYSRGNIVSSPAGINCSPLRTGCAASFSNGSTVSFSAPMAIGSGVTLQKYQYTSCANATKTKSIVRSTQSISILMDDNYTCSLVYKASEPVIVRPTPIAPKPPIVGAPVPKPPVPVGPTLPSPSPIHPTPTPSPNSITRRLTISGTPYQGPAIFTRPAGIFCRGGDGPECKADYPIGSRVQIVFPHSIGNQLFREYLCRGRTTSASGSNETPTIYLSEDTICSAYYGANGTNTLQLVGGAFTGAPITSNPAGIHCHGGNDPGCIKGFPNGSRVEVTFPSRIYSGSNLLYFDSYFCRGGRTTTVTGAKGKRVLTLFMYENFECTAYYY